MDTKLVTVYKGHPMDADIVKEVLKDNEINVNIKNELMGTIAPWHVSPGGFEPVEIEVLEKDKEQAMKLIKEFNKSVL